MLCESLDMRGRLIVFRGEERRGRGGLIVMRHRCIVDEDRVSSVKDLLPYMVILSEE